MKKSYQIAELFLKGRESVKLSHKQWEWLQNVLIKENGYTKNMFLFWDPKNTQYRLNADRSLYNVTLFKGKIPAQGDRAGI